MQKDFNVDKMKQEQVDDLLSNLPPEVEEVVELPSQSKFYSLEKPIVVRPMTFDDEKVIISSGKGHTNSLLLLLSRCVKNIDSRELLTMDKMYLFMKIRELSYGSDYEVHITCPSCGELALVKLDIRDFPVGKIPEDFEDPREFELPIIKQKVRVRFPRAKDDAYFKDIDSATENLWRFVEQIGDSTDKTVIAKVIALLQQKNAIEDVHKLIFEITRPDFGIETKFKYSCDECKESTVMEVPLGEDFFTRK